MSSTSVDVSPSDISSDDHSSEVVPVEATYSKLTDRIRRAASGSLSCRLFCGGARCKYESAEKWTAEEQAIPGLYSHWLVVPHCSLPGGGGGSVIELIRLHHYHRYSRIRVVMLNPFHKVSRRGDLFLKY